MTTELPKQYDPKAIEQPITDRWLEQKAFAAAPDDRENRYVIMMPLPNVTGALHMGHAMDNVMQDLLIRWHRMMGDNTDNTLWMTRTDHAGLHRSPAAVPSSFDANRPTGRPVPVLLLQQRGWRATARPRSERSGAGKTLVGPRGLGIIDPVQGAGASPDREDRERARRTTAGGME